MAGPVLYSTNVFLKLLIQEKFRQDIHFVWCSEQFDRQALARYQSGALVPPSSNPADIFARLKRDVDNLDRHSPKIAEQKASFMRLAIEWEQQNDITSDEKEDIIYMADTAEFPLWRPLLYVIPRGLVESRLQSVPLRRRAGFGNEYIIPDLQRSEFDVIEW